MRYSITEKPVYLRAGLIIVVSGLFVIGCVSNPQMVTFDGKAYVVGDSACMYYKKIEGDRIGCFNSRKQPVGYRRPMTKDEMTVFMHNQQMAAASAAQAAAYAPKNTFCQKIGQFVQCNTY